MSFCRDCRYFEAIPTKNLSETKRVGFCKRYPPQLIETFGVSPAGQPVQGTTSDFPKVSDHWPECGEFKNKPIGVVQ